MLSHGFFSRSKELVACSRGLFQHPHLKEKVDEGFHDVHWIGIRHQKVKHVFPSFCLDLLYTLQFSSQLYQRYNYFGDVKIVCYLHPLNSCQLGVGDFIPHYYSTKINSLIIEREFSTKTFEAKYEWIASGIMHELYNTFGIWKCPFFNDKGELKSDWLKLK